VDDLDRAIINNLQGGFPIAERPFAVVAANLGTSEDEVIRRIDGLLAAGILSRFGPLYDTERLGGGLTLAAMAVPADEFEAIAERVNGFPSVAHNYQREHELNMWFVVATETAAGLPAALADIEAEAGHQVYAMPKLKEYFLGLRLEA
jgi:DNA-binding Lrp family transcriptional regulator